jgi:hypothetical protein
VTDHRLRIAAAAAVGGLASAAVAAPWAWQVTAGAAAGGGASWVLGALTLPVAAGVWAAGGAWAAGRQGTWGAGAAAGALAAGVSGVLGWIPTAQVWALDELWAAAAAGTGSDELLQAVLRTTMASLVRTTVGGWWVLLALGAAAGAAGARVRAAAGGPGAAPVAWPMFVGRLSVLSAVTTAGAVRSLATNGLDVRMELGLNAGLVGALAAAPFVATARAHARGPLGNKVLAGLYAAGGALSVAIWATGWEPGAVMVPYVGLPLAGVLVGALAPAPTARRPEWRELGGECALAVVTGLVALVGPGCVSMGLAASLLPVAWIPGLAGQGTYPEVGPALVELYTWHWRVAVLVVAAGLPGTLLVAGALFAGLRWLLRPPA